MPINDDDNESLQVEAEGQKEKLTKKGYRDIERACRLLGLSALESEAVERVMEYRGRDGQLSWIAKGK